MLLMFDLDLLGYLSLLDHVVPVLNFQTELTFK